LKSEKSRGRYARPLPKSGKERGTPVKTRPTG
jgi:hypothetical protein